MRVNPFVSTYFSIPTYFQHLCKVTWVFKGQYETHGSTKCPFIPMIIQMMISLPHSWRWLLHDHACINFYTHIWVTSSLTRDFTSSILSSISPIKATLLPHPSNEAQDFLSICKTFWQVAIGKWQKASEGIPLG